MDQGIIQNVKVYYRGQIVRRFIADVEAKVLEPFQPSVLDAVRYVAKAWNSVLSSTVRNSFHKAGFQKVMGQEAECEEVENGSQFEDMMARLRTLDLAPLDLSFDSFANMDSDLIARATLTENEITQNVLHTEEEYISEDEEPEIVEEDDTKIKSAAEAYVAMERLRTFLEQNVEIQAEDRMCIQKVESLIDRVALKKMRQTTLDRYFA